MVPQNAMAKKLILALSKADIHWREYSGRGMFGQSCVGVGCGGENQPTEAEVIVAVQHVPGGIRPVKDALGKGTILYWPTAWVKETKLGEPQ